MYFKFLISCWDFGSNKFFESLLISFKGLLPCLVAFILANISPCIFNVGNCSVIDGSHVRIAESHNHLSVKLLSIESFWFYPIKNPLSELQHLLEEFWSKIVQLHLVKFLQILLVHERSHERHALSLLKEGREQSTNTIL